MQDSNYIRGYRYANKKIYKNAGCGSNNTVHTFRARNTSFNSIMFEHKVYSYDAFRKRTRDGIGVAGGARINLFHKERLSKYLAAVNQEQKNLAKTSGMTKYW